MNLYIVRKQDMSIFKLTNSKMVMLGKILNQTDLDWNIIIQY